MAPLKLVPSSIVLPLLVTPLLSPLLSPASPLAPLPASAVVTPAPTLSRTTLEVYILLLFCVFIRDLGKSLDFASLRWGFFGVS